MVMLRNPIQVESVDVVQSILFRPVRLAGLPGAASKSAPPASPAVRRSGFYFTKM